MLNIISTGRYHKGHRHQHGGMFLTAIFFIMLIGWITVAVQIIPLYLKNMAVQRAMNTLPEKIQRESESTSTNGLIEDTRKLFLADLRINNIYDIPMDALTFTPLSDDQIDITLDYETRRTLFFNIDVVLHFVDAIVVKKP